jgi:hypothetical protein
MASKLSQRVMIVDLLSLVLDKIQVSSPGVNSGLGEVEIKVRLTLQHIPDLVEHESFGACVLDLLLHHIG